MFDIKFNYVNGGVNIIKNTDDTNKINRVEGFNKWGDGEVNGTIK